MAEKFLVLQKIKLNGAWLNPGSLVELDPEDINKVRPELFNQAFGSVSRADIRQRGLNLRHEHIEALSRNYEALAAKEIELMEEEERFLKSMESRKSLAAHQTAQAKKRLDAAQAEKAAFLESANGD